MAHGCSIKPSAWLYTDPLPNPIRSRCDAAYRLAEASQTSRRKLTYLPVEFTEGDQDANMWLLWRYGKKSYPSSVPAISPQALTAIVCRSSSSALKVKPTSFAILASVLKALANPIAEASRSSRVGVHHSRHS